MPTKKTTAIPDAERFQSGADLYAAYLKTPEGRLRLDLALANLRDFLPHVSRPLLALDIGCGTGDTGVRLARLGHHVTLLDASLPMLNFAKRTAQDAGVNDRITVKQGDAAQLETLFPAGSFDLILCHNILEYVDDPVAVLRGAATGLRNSSSVISVLVRNQTGEVLKAAIQEGDLGAAEHDLTAEWGHESLYGGSVRLFAREKLQAMLETASLVTIAERGVRVVSDYLPSKASRSHERSNQYDRIFALEWKLGRRPEFAAIARYTHCLARPAGPAMKE